MFFTSAGSRFYIGGGRPEWDAGPTTTADFVGEIWTEVAGLISLGRISGEWMLDETVTPACDGATTPMPHVVKSVRPARRMQLFAGVLADDPGQVKLLEAEDSPDAFAFRITLSNGSARQFIAKVVGVEDVYDEANSILALSFGIVLQSNLIEG